MFTFCHTVKKEKKTKQLLLPPLVSTFFLLVTEELWNPILGCSLLEPYLPSFGHLFPFKCQVFWYGEGCYKCYISHSQTAPYQ